MFRRKRFNERAASVPWWPSEDSGRAGFPGTPSVPGAPGGPAGFGDPGAPPLAAHDPFGGWPAFGDGYSDGFSADAGGPGYPDAPTPRYPDGGAPGYPEGPAPGYMGGYPGGMPGMSGQGHPANGWPLVDGWADERDAADPAGFPADGRARGGHPSAGPSPAQRLADVHPAAGFPSDVHPAAAFPSDVHPAAGFPAPGQPVTGFPADAVNGSHQPGAPAVPGAGQSEGLPDWLPLLTHPIGGQRFQPGLEAAPEPSECPTPGRPPRRRNGRRPKARRKQGAPIDGSEADPTTWIPTVTASDTELSSAAGPRTTHPNPGAVPASADPDPDPAEASSLAGAFAADYLSWDEDNPARRGQVLAQYLPSDIKGDPSLLGWSGKGRQRSEFALPGAVHPDGEGRVLVDVRVRVTPFRQVGPADRAPAASSEARLEVAGVPAVAPAPSARGWKSQDSHWVRLTVPVTRDQGRLVVDTWDEQLGDDSDESDSETGAGATPGGTAGAGDSDDPGTADDADDTDDEIPADENSTDAAPTRPARTRATSTRATSTRATSARATSARKAADRKATDR